MNNAPRVEATHVVIALHAAIHDGGVTLLGDTLGGDTMVDPVGISPHAGIDLTKLDGAAGVVDNGVLEGGVEVAIVEEDVGIVEPSIEVTLDGLDGLDDAFEFLVAG